MAKTLLGIGIACVVAAIVGGGLKALEIEFPLVESLTRQLLLAGFGIILILAAVAMEAPNLMRYLGPGGFIIILALGALWVYGDTDNGDGRGVDTVTPPVPELITPDHPTEPDVEVTVTPVFFSPDTIHLGDEELTGWPSLFGSCLDIEFQVKLPIQSLTVMLETFGAEAPNPIYLNGHEVAILPPQGIDAPNDWTEARSVSLPIGGLVTGTNKLAVCSAQIEIAPDFPGDKDDFQIKNIRLVAE